MSDFESLWVDRAWSRDVDLSFNPMVVASSTEQILPCPRLKSCRWLYLAGPGHYQFPSWPGLPRVRGREGEYKQIMHIWRLQIVITYHESYGSGFLIPARYCFNERHLWLRRTGELSGAETLRSVRRLLTLTVYKEVFIIIGYHWWINTHWLQLTSLTGP